MQSKTIFALVALASATLVNAQDSMADGSALVGKPIKPFHMTSVEGKILSDKSLKGKPYVLDFWATWCPPCVASGPTIQGLYTSFSKLGFMAIGANVSDTVKAVKSYKAHHKYTFTFTAGNDAYVDSLGFSGIPVFIFVDKKGIVRHVQSGFDSDGSPKVFEGYAKSLLK